MFGINGLEFVALAIIAVLVIGPERLPEYASQLGRLVKELRRMATGARQQLKDEVGSEFTDVDWQKLDPRQYDPRRIIREALLEDDEPVKPQSPRPRDGGTAAGSAAASATAAGTTAAGATGAGTAATAGTTSAGATAAGAAPDAAQSASSTAAGPGVPSDSPPEPQPWPRRRSIQELQAGEPAPFDNEAT